MISGIYYFSSGRRMETHQRRLEAGYSLFWADQPQCIRRAFLRWCLKSLPLCEAGKNMACLALCIGRLFLFLLFVNAISPSGSAQYKSTVSDARALADGRDRVLVCTDFWNTVCPDKERRIEPFNTGSCTVYPCSPALLHRKSIHFVPKGKLNR